jgi:hypothetical protein
MANQWFRLYAEFATDPKVQMLPEALQRRLIMIFCLRCGNDDVTLQDNEVTFQLRISNEEWQETKKIFIEKGFMDSENNVLNWDKRQFRSDTSNARVAKHREKKRLEKTSQDAPLKMKQECNVTVTPPDTDTDTDIKTTNVVLYNVRFKDFWDVYPKKTKRKEAEAVWKRKRLDRFAPRIIEDVKLRTEKHRTWLEGFVPHATTYLNGERWEDEIEDLPSKDGGNHATDKQLRKQQHDKYAEDISAEIERRIKARAATITT